LNSSDRGSAARGRVALQDLRKFQYGAREAVGAFKYRVALVHHHLLPLPDRPVEFDQGAEKIRRKLYDESTKLLTNAGLVTNTLLESSIDLVLDGHEHKQFAASVKYHDREWAGHIVAVVGGPAATAGFQVVTFAPSGDVELVRPRGGIYTVVKIDLDLLSIAELALLRDRTIEKLAEKVAARHD
jgi:hypothetical protein